MNKALKGILLALFVAGVIAALGKVFVWGDSVTNIGSYAPWGLWVGLYILLAGAAAGAAWTAIYAARQNGGRPNSLSSICLLVAGVCLAFGLAFIGIDLGKPLSGIKIFTSPTFSSQLAWASWIYPLFFVCIAGYFLSKAQKTFMYLAGIVAVGFLIAEGLFFGGMIARSLWYSWLTPLSFFTAAIAAGSALVYAVGITANKEVFAEEGIGLQKVVLYSVAAHAVVEGIHLAVGLSGSTAKAELVKTMWAAWPFLGLFIIVGVIVPVYLLLKGTDRMSIIPAVLAFIGLAAYKYSFVRYGFSTEPLPGISQAFQHGRLATIYTPSLVEWVVAVGLIAGLVWVASFIIEKMHALDRA